MHYRKTLARARIAAWAQRALRRWASDRERVALVGIRQQWLAQKDEISTLRAQLEKMKQMYSEVGKKAGALPEVMGKFSELQSYAKSLKAEYERRIGELEEHIDKMAAGEESHINAKESAQRRLAELEAEVGRLREDLAKARKEGHDLTSKHSELGFSHAQCEGIQMRLQLTVDEQAQRIGELEAGLVEMEDLREKNRLLQNELRGRDGTLAENEEQLEEMEEHVENLSAAMVASEAAERKLQEQLDSVSGDKGELAEKLAEAEAQRDEAEKELVDTRDELAAILRKLEATQDECAELTTENRDVKASNDRIDALNEELRDAVGGHRETKHAPSRSLWAPRNKARAPPLWLNSSFLHKEKRAALLSLTPWRACRPWVFGASARACPSRPAHGGGGYSPPCLVTPPNAPAPHRWRPDLSL